MARSSRGARLVFASRRYVSTRYGVLSSSSSQRMRCERELFRWWTTITVAAPSLFVEGGIAFSIRRTAVPRMPPADSLTPIWRIGGTLLLRREQAEQRRPLEHAIRPPCARLV